MPWQFFIAVSLHSEYQYKLKYKMLNRRRLKFMRKDKQVPKEKVFSVVGTLLILQGFT